MSFAAMFRSWPATVRAVPSGRLSLQRPGALPSAGQPLAPAVRSFMEPRLHHDFSSVRVHTDDTAARSAVGVNAAAYTVGHDVVFAPGQFRPATSDGRALIAHELAHVVQQSRGGSPPSPAPGGALERDAKSAAATVAAGGAARVAGASGTGLARAFGPESLSHNIDPSGMTAPQIEREIELLTRWLQDNKSGPDTDRLAATLRQLKEELGRRPIPPSDKGGDKPGGPKSLQMRFSLPAVAEPAAPAGPQFGRAEAPNINTPPPVIKPSHALDALSPPQPQSTVVRKTEQPADPPPAATPAKPADKKAEEEKPALGLQTGAGEQTNLRQPHQAFGYVQVSAEWSNKYLGELKLPDSLPTILRSVKLLGEPGLTFQYHALGDAPKQWDAQFLMKLAQLSLGRVDVSAVAGAGYNDLSSKPSLSRLAPLGGLEVEPKIGKLGPVELSWVLDGLVTYSVPGTQPGTPPNAPPPQRRLDSQFSGELRLKVDLPW